MGRSRKRRKPAITVVGLVALVLTTQFVPSARAGSGAPLGPGEGVSTLGGATSGVLAFLVQPNDVAAGSPIDPEVKVEALDTLGDVLTGAIGAAARARPFAPSSRSGR